MAIKYQLRAKRRRIAHHADRVRALIRHMTESVRFIELCCAHPTESKIELGDAE